MPFVDKSTLTYPATNSFPVRKWQDTRNPDSGDYKNFQIFDIWINTAARTAWIMVDKTANTGFWIQMASSGTGILTISGDSGGPVGPDGVDNINLLSGANLTVTGNAGTNTLTITLDGTIASQYTTDSGIAFPSGGNLDIDGTNGIETSASGDVVTLTLSGNVPLLFTADLGSAQPALNELEILGSSLVQTSGIGNAITVSLEGEVASQYTTDSGIAIPVSNNLNLIGNSGISTSASGDTVTINGLNYNEIIVAGPTSMTVNNGYVANSVSTVELTLPATSIFGSIIKIIGKGSGGWQINQNAGQSIIMQSSLTSTGVGGRLNSINQYDCLELVCTTADTIWTISSGTGNYLFT